MKTISALAGDDGRIYPTNMRSSCRQTEEISNQKGISAPKVQSGSHKANEVLVVRFLFVKYVQKIMIYWRALECSQETGAESIEIHWKHCCWQ